MTVSSTTTKVSYNGDNSTTVFAYTFKIFDDDDITVILRTVATGTESVQTKTTDYSVSGVGNTNGGNITFVTAPASGVTVVLLRETAQTQTTDYTPNDPFPASSHEDALDKVTLIVQDQQEELNRALKLSRTNTMASTEFTVGATTRANKILAFDSSGELAVTQEIGTFQGNWTTSTSYFERDLVRDSTTNNVFIVNSAHTSSGSEPLTTNPNSAKYDLILEAELQGNLLGDTTPQLGGDLDLNSNDITGTGNIDITGGLTTTGGITFNGNTADANALDDYEEGNWTPVLDGQTTSPTSPTSGSGKYTKIGNQVVLFGTITDISVSGGSGNAQITGLPFTCGTAIASGNVPGTLYLNSFLFPNANDHYAVVEAVNNQSYLNIRVIRDNSNATVVGCNTTHFVEGATDFRFQVTYRTTA